MNNEQLIGDIRISRLPYYDKHTKTVKYKGRPVLIVNVEKEEGTCDVTCLPVASVKNETNLSEYYDEKIDSDIYPELKLTNKVSYVRSHKVQTIHSSSLSHYKCSNMKTSYPDLYEVIVQKLSDYFK